MTTFVLTRDVGREECPWLPEPLLPAGTVVTKFSAATYGCIDRSVGTAVTFNVDPQVYPFFELPTDALEVQ